MILRRRCPYRAFRNMGVPRQVHDHALAADARGNAIDQGGQLIIVVHIGVEIALLLHDDFGAACAQADEIKAETGIEAIAHRLFITQLNATFAQITPSASAAARVGSPAADRVSRVRSA